MKQFPQFMLGLILLSIFTISSALAGTFTTVKSGNWSDPYTWASNGRSGIPGAADDVNVSGRDDLTIDVTASCASFTLKAANGGSMITIPGSVKLTVSGITTINTPTQDGDAKTIAVGAGTLETGHLVLTGTNGTRKGVLTLSTGLVKVYGNITFNGGIYAVITATGNGIIRVGGLFGSNGTFEPGASSTVIFDGTTAQVMPALLNYAHVITENPAGVTLNGEIPQGRVTGNLTVNTGTLSNGGFPMAGMAGSAIEVKNNASLLLTGTTGFPAGFGTIVLEPTSRVSYQGANQNVAALTYGRLMIARTGQPGTFKTLSGSAKVITALEMSTSNLAISNFILTLEAGASISGPSANAFIVQGSAGKLLMKGIGTGGNTGEVIFPVGTSATAYTPALIKNEGPANDFSVNVQDGVRDRSGTLITTNVVKKTWNVNNETTNGTPQVRMRLQWGTTEEATNFNRMKCAINHFDAITRNWERVGGVVQAEGTNPYLALGTGIYNFSPFAVSNDATPLPVELLYFNAYKDKDGAFLKWETATEKNNKGFDIQVSADGKAFESVGFVETTNGNASYNQKYEYTDKQNGKSGLWYYRLKQTDQDGTEAYSPIQAVDFGKTASDVIVYPNPFQNQFALKLLSQDVSEVSIEIHNLTGMKIYEGTQTLSKGVNNIPLEISNQPAGIYLLSAKAAGQAYQARIVKE